MLASSPTVRIIYIGPASNNSLESINLLVFIQSLKLTMEDLLQVPKLTCYLGRG
jgi:hypothetical protein